MLALTTGAVNAVTFLRLGTVFSSVITGNMALLGIAVGQRDGELALNGGLAVAGYGLGVFIGGAMSGASARQHAVWPRRTTVTLAAELLVLLGFTAGWLATDGRPAGGARLVLLVIPAAAMGLQSSAVRRLGHMSSTYLTSTLTGILEAFSGGRRPAHWQRSTGALLALVAGAALGSAATSSAALVPVAVLVPLAAVLACAATSASLRDGHPEGAGTPPDPATPEPPPGDAGAAGGSAGEGTAEPGP